MISGWIWFFLSIRRHISVRTILPILDGFSKFFFVSTLPSFSYLFTVGIFDFRIPSQKTLPKILRSSEFLAFFCTLLQRLFLNGMLSDQVGCTLAISYWCSSRNWRLRFLNFILGGEIYDFKFGHFWYFDFWIFCESLIYFYLVPQTMIFRNQWTLQAIF